MTLEQITPLAGYTHKEIHALNGDAGVVYMAAFSPNCRTLATVDEQHIQLFDVKSGQLVATTDVDFSRQLQIEFSPDGQQLLCRGLGRSVYLLNSTDLSVVVQLSGHKQTLTDARFSKDGQLIATASGDGTARIWNAQTGTVNQVLNGHRKTVLFAVFDPAGGLLATSSQDRRVRLWDVRSGEQLAVLGRAQRAGRQRVVQS